MERLLSSIVFKPRVVSMGAKGFPDQCLSKTANSSDTESPLG